jgi:hypothetical protein
MPLRLRSGFGLRARLLVVAIATAVCAAALLHHAHSAMADQPCVSSPPGCSPGSGYSMDEVWDCGVLASGGSDRCYYNAVKSYSSGIAHTWGWGSSAYPGSGHTRVGLDAANSSQSYFGGWGTDILYVCYHLGCYDQGDVYLKMSVFQSDGAGANHTVLGHGKA